MNVPGGTWNEVRKLDLGAVYKLPRNFWNFSTIFRMREPWQVPILLRTQMKQNKGIFV